MPDVLGVPPAVYKKWRPSGRNCGKLWPYCADSTRVTAFASPPEAEIRNRGPTSVDANRMTPSAFHAPPPYTELTPARDWTEPVSISIRFSVPSAKNPTERPSADQNGSRSPHPSVPGSMRAVVLSSERSHNRDCLSLVAANTIF